MEIETWIQQNYNITFHDGKYIDKEGNKFTYEELVIIFNSL
jgi:hypothetical protein